MRLCILLISLAQLLPGTLPAQQQGGRWALVLSFARESFRGASSDTSSIPGTTVEVYPSSRLSTELGLGRRIGTWDVTVSAGYASGDLRAKTDLLVLDDRTTSVKRYRGALLLSRRLAGFRESSLLLVGGPVVDHWTTTGLGDRTTLGGRVGVALRVPLGRLELENRALFGIGASPFNRRDLPPEAKIESLRSWSLGVALRLRL
ncbi:MAG: hypothetical protein ABI742_04505 [Gemmatimonadota bacterium]